MSMMFDALKAMETPAGNSATPASIPPVRARLTRQHWLAIAVGGGVLLAVAGWWASTTPAPAAVPVQSAQSSSHASTAAPIDNPPVAVTEARVAATAAIATPVPAATPATAAIAPPVPAVAIAPATPTAVPAVPATQQPTAQKQAIATPAAPETQQRAQPDALVAEISVRNAGDVAPVAEDQSVAALVAAIGTAVHAGDFSAADAQLAKLQKNLPPRSLTLLRMQAWVAHTRGDAATAIALYRKIVNRVPDDQTTTINLAMLEADNGQAESARDRLQQLRANADDANSVAVERAMRLVEAKLR